MQHFVKSTAFRQIERVVGSDEAIRLFKEDILLLPSYVASRTDTLSSAFRWSESKYGHEFWSNIRNGINPDYRIRPESTP